MNYNAKHCSSETCKHLIFTGIGIGNFAIELGAEEI